ncbi:MAG TPA: hypothetical protein VGR41_02620 [Actinomycetota bacterium]|jgi:hypothetical protein|nr:hypothetical protein [Actinomycetota bacterium]
MDDSFNFGKPSKRGPQVNLSPRLVLGLAVLAAASLLVFFGMKFFASSGEEVAKNQASVVQQVDRSQDVVPQNNLRNALVAAQTAFVENSSYTDAGPAELAAIEPSLQYTDGPSTAPSIISVAATPDQWSAAAMAESGTCFWISVSPSTDPTYGTGAPCTGVAAASAADVSW